MPAFPRTQLRRRRAQEAHPVVDDDRSFLELAERLLLKEGFSAICHQPSQIGAQLARTAQARCDPARYPDARLRRLGRAGGAASTIRSRPPSRS